MQELTVMQKIERARQAQQVAEGKQLEHPLQLEIPNLVQGVLEDMETHIALREAFKSLMKTSL